LALVPAESILRALAAQSGVSYLAKFDVSRLPPGPEWLPEETVRALGLVPFEVDDDARRLKVLCAAPVPRAALRALTKLTAWIAEPYLVEDAVLEEALRAYRCDRSETTSSPVTTRVSDFATAASRVADVALADRAVTMRHATYDDCTWVRVEGPQQWSDVWIVPSQEEPCLAASTVH
jgi:Type II secretion system (T2SS), protein E, N-terminal domain